MISSLKFMEYNNNIQISYTVSPCESGKQNSSTQVFTIGVVEAHNKRPLSKKCKMYFLFVY